jgi:pilus assembly protein CpaF
MIWGKPPAGDQPKSSATQDPSVGKEMRQVQGAENPAQPDNTHADKHSNGLPAFGNKIAGNNVALSETSISNSSHTADHHKNAEVLEKTAEKTTLASASEQMSTTAAAPLSAGLSSIQEALKTRIHRRLIQEIDLNKLQDDNQEVLRQQVRSVVQHLLTDEHVLLSGTERDALIDDILGEMMGLGPLEHLMKDQTVSDILINGPHCIFVERKGKLVESEIKFKDNNHLLQIIDRIVSAVGRRVDETQPLCDARMHDGSRFNCVIPPLALDGALVSIRKFSKDKLKIHDLVNFGALTQPAADLLKGCVEARLNMVISGGTGSGKTTLLNVLSGFIPDDERIVTIEDAAELQLQQRHVARMETRPANIEGRGEITQRELVKNALRMRPERIILGECRSGEALDMLQAMNTGHDGSLTTLHANTPRDALRRLETMVMMAGYDLPIRAIREQIASAVHIIIQANRLSDGSRKVLYISEVVGMEGDIILLQDIFAFVQYGTDENKKVVGEFKYTGVRPKFLDVLVSKGIPLDMSLFTQL